jgi:hypothetical protein
MIKEEILIEKGECLTYEKNNHICYDIYDVNYNGCSFYGGSCIGGGEKAEQKTGDIDSKLQ